MAKWGRDTRLETFLKRLHVKFKWQLAYPLNKIDFGESLNRQTRFGKNKIDDLLVNSYGVQLLDGAEFPGILVNQQNKHLAYIISGLHRGHAAKDIGEEAIDCYVTELTDTRLLDIIPRTVNALEGRRPDREELIQNALYLCEAAGFEAKDVCDMFGLKPEHITLAKRQQDVAQAIRAEGVSPDGIAKSLLIKISPVAGNKNVLRALSKLIKHEGVGFTDAENIIEDVKAGKTEAEQLQTVRTWKDDIEGRAEKKLPPTIRSGNRTRFLSALNGLDRFLDNIDRAEKLQLGDDDIEVVAQTAERVTTKLRALINERLPMRNGRS